jgi:RNA polymerase sigma-70 factor (ECF subfamily)
MRAAVASAPDLLDRCVAGDSTAWSELHRAYRPQALGFLRRLGVGRREAEDACQEVFLQMFRYLGRFEHRADFRTWLFKLCISQAARLRRRARLLRPLSWLGLADPVSQPEWSASRAVELVDRALASLSDGERAVFVLFEFEGVSTAEVARAVGLPDASTRRKLQEARAKFERYVRDEPFGGKP